MEPSHPRSSKLRQGRFSESGRIYHLRTCTYERRLFFSDFFLGRVVVNGFRFLHERGDVSSLAFVVMPEHLHWLIELKGKRSLDAVMQSLKGYTARGINALIGRPGKPVWQAGYFDRALRTDEDVREVARYIIGNPLRAGLCKDVGKYPLWDAIWL